MRRRRALRVACRSWRASLEVALHKANELEFPLDHIVDGIAAAPLSPPHPDFVIAMGRTNDAIIYGGQVQLFVTGPASEARALAEQLPGETSRDYGGPFAEIFKRFKGDFYAIDPMLFSPAAAIVTSIESGESFRAGGRFEPARCLASLKSAVKPVSWRIQAAVVSSRLSTGEDWHARRACRRLRRAASRCFPAISRRADSIRKTPSGLSIPGRAQRLPTP